MGKHLEEALREEAINRRLSGQRPCAIYRALGRARSWFDKWWARYRQEGREGLKDRSGAPRFCPHKMPQPVEDAIVRIRKVLQQGSDPELKYAFVGAETIQWELRRMGYDPPPSIPAINSALKRRDLVQPGRGVLKRRSSPFVPILSLMDPIGSIRWTSLPAGSKDGVASSPFTWSMWLDDFR